ncbi:phage head-tail connector protein [uncultured Ramlibacter sp.]|uniref:head-tail connector protein n=1 Tax=uncultured Ramlibacter sp. TaxID=260755 RepID=UPI00260E379A|nr:phage head-tail connector protein [uncultured Ramlibacter sp.]
MQFKITVPVDFEDEPVSLAEARLQCKVDDDDTSHDDALKALITTAREYAEHYTGHGLAPQTLEAALDCFPGDDGVIELPKCPVSEVTSIKYTDTDGNEQTFASIKYALSPYGLARNLAPSFGNYWPVTQDVMDSVRIVQVCGYTAELLPKAAKQAMLIHIELESPLNPHTPAEREAYEKARDSMLNNIKIYGF